MLAHFYTLRVVDNAIFIAIKFSSTKILVTLSIFMFSLFVLCYYCKSEIDKDKLIYYGLEHFISFISLSLCCCKN